MLIFAGGWLIAPRRDRRRPTPRAVAERRGHNWPVWRPITSRTGTQSQPPRPCRSATPIVYRPLVDGFGYTLLAAAPSTATSQWRSAGRRTETTRDVETP